MSNTVKSEGGEEGDTKVFSLKTETRHSYFQYGTGILNWRNKARKRNLIQTGK